MTSLELSPNAADRIVAAVEARRDDLIALTRALVSCRTDSQTADNAEFASEAERCQTLIASQLTEIGMSVERWTDPPHYPVVVGRLPGLSSGRSLAINGHIDVVPAGDRAAWQYDPWAGDVADGKLWGRGATDMKGGVACGIMAVRALRDVMIELHGDLWLHVVADEEVVGFSTRHLVKRLPKADAVIVAEPTDLKLMPVEGGLVHFRIEVEGRESHAGNRYMSIHAGGLGNQAGINAVEKTMKIMSALQELERQWANLRHHPLLPGGFNSIMPGLIVGGPGGGHDGRLNQMAIPGTCPDYCSVEYNLWYLPGETFEQIQAEVETYVSDVCRTDPWLREHPPRFTWKLRNIFLPAAETTPDHPFIQTLAGALTRISISPTVEGFTAGSELAWYAEQGINGTIFGPGRIAQAHSPNEYVEIEQLMHSCTAMALAGAAWCGAPEG